MHTSSKQHQSSFMAYSHQKGTFERRLNGALVFVTMQLSSLNWLLKLHVSTLNWFNVQVVVSTGHQVSGRFNGINKHAGSQTNPLKLLPKQSNLVEFENVDLPLSATRQTAALSKVTRQVIIFIPVILENFRTCGSMPLRWGGRLSPLSMSHGFEHFTVWLRSIKEGVSFF